MRRPAAALAALTLCCALSACGTDQPTTQTTPVTSTSVSAPNPAPASPDPARDPLYLEAVDVYQKYFAEMQKFEAAGYPTKTLPASMDAYITGGMKEATQGSIDSSFADHVAPQRGARSNLVWVKPNPGVRRGNSTVAIRTCVDGSQSNVVDTRTGQVVGRGAIVLGEVFFTREGDRLKASSVDEKEVASCAR